MLKSRSGHPVNAPVSTPPSIEAVRRKARHRLIGASVLVLGGVIGFSLLFDTQPRPISVDIPIEIPTRAAVPPAPIAPSPSAAVPVPSQPPVRSQETLDEREEVVSEPASAPPAPAVAESPAQTPAATSAAKSPPGGSATQNDGARAQALLEGRAASGPAPVSTTTTPGQTPAAAPVRLVVQVGAFADNARAQEVRQRLERAGLKTYTHVAETPEGRRIRVRVGPFDNRQEAEKVAERVKRLNLQARILTL
jgi:DedD protein